jgi:hypothetical protein
MYFSESTEIKWQDFKLTEEDVKKIREHLEKATEESFRSFKKRRIESWVKSKNVVLD